MKKLNENKKTKVVVFDFDDTLYSGLDWSPWFDYCIKGLKEITKDLPLALRNKVIHEANYCNFTDVSIAKMLKRNNIYVKLWLKYRNNNLCKLDHSTCKVTSRETIKKFEQNYTLYIVSNSTINDIKNTSKKLNFYLSPFKRIICNQFTASLEKLDYSKQIYYQQIIDHENINPEELFVIGNSKKSDIIPALLIGARGKLVYEADFEFEDFDLENQFEYENI